MIPELLASLDTEDAEFVRPALVRALAALGSDARVSSALVRETGRGEDFCRSAVIEALGDYKAAYAIDVLAAIARQDGPLLDDSALALGKIGDLRALETLATLQRSASPALQPIVAASTCLIGVQCAEQEQYLIDTIKTSGESGQHLRRWCERESPAFERWPLPDGPRPPRRCWRSVHTRATRFARPLHSRWRRSPFAIPHWRLLCLLEKAQQADAISLLAEGFLTCRGRLRQGTVLRTRSERRPGALRTDRQHGR